MSGELEWVKASRSREARSARELLDAAVYELRCRRFPDLEHGAALLHNIVAASLAIQCENLGVPYDAERVKGLTDALSLRHDPAKARHAVVDAPERWCEEVDQMFRLRTCANCGSVLFPGMHSEEECDREIVRSVMES